MLKIGKKSKGQITAEGEVEGFREDLGPFVVATETTRMAMVFTNAREAGEPIIFANDSFLALTGYERDEVLGQGFDTLMARGSAPAVLAKLAAIFSVGGDSDLEVCYSRKDGSVFWAAIFISPVRDDHGQVVQHFISFVDLSRHKQELARSRMFIDELNHRVKNTLATVQSMVSQTLRQTSHPELIREAIESRIFALSRSHDLLSRESWNGAELHDVIAAALAPFRNPSSQREPFVMTGQKVRLPSKATLALGMAFHELATNAVKHGALSGVGGSVLVSWVVKRTSGDLELNILWQEKDGPAVSLPSRSGFGTRLLEHGVAHELEGTVVLQYREDGVSCAITFPVLDDRNE
ncbi:PAS domain S-box [Neorhizobium galegae bv. orientalis]|nr:PAS domain S-box [Neorhizobium galegae bv. orientalis]